MMVKTETIAWILVTVLGFYTFISVVNAVVDAPKVVCACTECTYSMGKGFSIIMPIGHEKIKVSGTISIYNTCDKAE